MLSTSAQTHTHYKNDIRFPGCFDVPAAVMSLVVKLLFPFNIVYRHRHLLELVICPFMRCTVLPVNSISTHSTAAGHQHQSYLMHEYINLFWRFGHFYISYGWFITEAIKISVYRQDRIWIIHALHVGWKNRSQENASFLYISSQHPN